MARKPRNTHAPKRTKEVAERRVPLPDHVEPKNVQRHLMASVRIYFYALYNSADKTFKEWLISVGNKDALTGNRLFDRHQATLMVRTAADKANDHIVTAAKDGDIYRCIVNLMRGEGWGLKLRRAEQLTLPATPTEQPAE
jgi:hypothetical protein